MNQPLRRTFEHLNERGEFEHLAVDAPSELTGCQLAHLQLGRKLHGALEAPSQRHIYLALADARALVLDLERAHRLAVARDGGVR
jgi:hypothetical protein